MKCHHKGICFHSIWKAVSREQHSGSGRQRHLHKEAAGPSHPEIPQVGDRNLRSKHLQVIQYMSKFHLRVGREGRVGQGHRDLRRHPHEVRPEEGCRQGDNEWECVPKLSQSFLQGLFHTGNRMYFLSEDRSTTNMILLNSENVAEHRSVAAMERIGEDAFAFWYWKLFIFRAS